MKILVLNSGSSSQKSALFELSGTGSTEPATPLWEAKLEWGGPAPELVIRTSTGTTRREQASLSDRRARLEGMLETLWNGEARVLADRNQIDVVGHRVVHGGPQLTEPTQVTAEVKSAIASAASFAPLHSRSELEGMSIVEELLGEVPQVAVFDTGFHATLPRPA